MGDPFLTNLNRHTSQNHYNWIAMGNGDLFDITLWLSHDAFFFVYDGKHENMVKMSTLWRFISRNIQLIEVLYMRL